MPPVDDLKNQFCDVMHHILQILWQAFYLKLGHLLHG
jgi:hypothetical protein